MKNRRFWCSVILVLAAAAASAEGALNLWPVAEGGNGHFYEPVALTSVVTWQQANLAATEAGGYLVTITSEAENDFVFSLIDDPAYWNPSFNLRGPWTGGFQQIRSPEPDGGWSWVTGEPFVYSNWDDEQPNDFGPGNENRIHFGNRPERTPTWNDVPESYQEVTSYVIEYIPEPCTGLLLLLGAGAVLRRRAPHSNV